MSDEVTIQIMGRPQQVPRGLTIMKAIEHAGHRIVRGVGCRAGFCGACGTLYRMPGSYKLKAGLACQTQVEDGMALAGIPFVPANRAPYAIDELDPEARPPDGTLLATLYPELSRCISCNTCTKACPQSLDVMDYASYALRDDFARVAAASFDCIQCGLCALRCPAEIAHHHVAQVARRLYARHQVPRSEQLAARCQEMAAGEYENALDVLVALDEQALRERYAARVKEEAA